MKYVISFLVINIFTPIASIFALKAICMSGITSDIPAWLITIGFFAVVLTPIIGANAALQIHFRKNLYK